MSPVIAADYPVREIKVRDVRRRLPISARVSQMPAKGEYVTAVDEAGRRRVMEVVELRWTSVEPFDWWTGLSVKLRRIR